MSIIQQIFKDHGDAYIERYAERIPEAHIKSIRAIQQCRTGLRGHHVFICPDCGRQSTANSSCGNRHCPVCQNDKAAEWVHRQQLKLLPCTYFLATFTVPEALRPVIRSNQRVLYTAMFNCAAASLRTLEADKRFVGCKVAGFFGVLHSWGRQLQYHPHVHFVIPGGGLTASRDKWISATGNFLVHVRALSKMFRGKMRDAMIESNLIELVSPQVWKQDWVVHCKSVGDGRCIMKYLGAYVFRVAVSDSRIAGYDGRTIRLKYRKVGSNRDRIVTLSSFEFMRRYLQHILPQGFMKVRHYGFLSHNFSLPLHKIRELICRLYEILRDQLATTIPPLQPTPKRCPACKTVMKWSRFIPPTGTVGASP